jgi:hypothetical protein
MFDYREELERRIGQFESYLKKMHNRAHEEVQGPCFMIFEEDLLGSDTEDRALTEAVRPALELVEAAFKEAGITGTTVAADVPMIHLPEDGWREDDSEFRFIQFSFEEKWFCMDMPLQTLYRAEAEQILRGRRGFFYLKDRPEFTLHGEDVDGYDPFRKVYVYGDERAAAEDMAFVFFHVWKFPVDWRFYVKAAAFSNKKTDWESGTPIE